MKSEINDQYSNYAFINFASNEEISSDLQKKLKRINKLPDGLFEIKFKIDRYKFDRAIKNELSAKDSLQNLFDDVMTQTKTNVSLRMTSKSNSKLRHPMISVIGDLNGIESAKERILAAFENIKMRVTLKVDVSYKDHSHIIGRGGFSIQRVMDDTGSHIHFPDSNRISEVKKSNVVLVCGSPQGVEEARCKIRNLLPLVVHFKIPTEYLNIEYLKRSPSTKLVETYSKYLRPITSQYNVHISVRNSTDIDEGYAAIFDSNSNTSEYVAVSVRGANNDLDKLKESLSILIERLTDSRTNLDIDYVLTIEITESYHQLVMGNNYLNIKSIMQQTGCRIHFPESESSQRVLDYDNLNEIPVNKSTVIIKGGSFDAVHTAWKELIGYLPLVLSFDVPHDQPLDTDLINQLKKQYKVAIFLKHREKFNTVMIRGIEKNSRTLFEVRKQLLELDDNEQIPACCLQHNPHLAYLEQQSKLFGLDDNALLNSLINQNCFGNGNGNASNLNNLMNGNPMNLLNASKMIQNLDPNNNLNDKMNYLNNNNQPYNVDVSLLQRNLQERILLFQANQLNQRTNKSSSQFNSIQFNGGNNNMFNNNGCISSNLNDELQKMARQQHVAAGLIDSSLRNTHSVSDIQSLHTNHSVFLNDNLHHSLLKKEHQHLTTSCSSPSLHAMVQQSNNNLLIGNNSHHHHHQQHHHNNNNNNNNNSFTMNTSNLNSTGNNTSSSSATASTANNSFNNSNGLTSSPSNANCSNSSFNSLLHNQQSPIQPNHLSNHHAEKSNINNNINWLDRQNYDELKLLAIKKTFEKPDSNEVRIPSNVWSGLGFSKSMSHDTITRSNQLNEWNNGSSSIFNSPGNNNNLQKNSIINKTNLGAQSSTDNTTDYVWSHMSIGPNNTTKQRALIKQESEICSSTHPYTSNYLNSLMNGDNHNQQQFTNFSTGQYLPKNNNNNTNTIHQFNTNDHGQQQSQGNYFFDVNAIDLSIVLCESGLANYVDTFRQHNVNFAQFLSLTEDDLKYKLGLQQIGRSKVYHAIIELRRLLQSDRVGNNNSTTKNRNENLKSDQSDELLNCATNDLHSLIHQSESTNNKSSIKDLNDNLASKFSIFNDTSANNDDPQKTNTNSINALSSAFDTLKFGKCETIDDDMNSNEIASTNEIKLDLNVDGDISRSENNKTATTSVKTTGEFSTTSIKNDDQASDDEKNDNKNQDLINHGSVEEVAQA